MMIKYCFFFSLECHNSFSYGYSGGGILSSCFCMITCSLYGIKKKKNLLNVILQNHDRWFDISLFSIFKQKWCHYCLLGLFVLLIYFLFNFFFFTFKSFPVVGLVKLSRADVKQSDFKNNNNLTKKKKRQNEDPKGRTIGRGAQYVVRECVCFPHTNFMRHSFMNRIVYFFWLSSFFSFSL